MIKRLTQIFLKVHSELKKEKNGSVFAALNMDKSDITLHNQSNLEDKFASIAFEDALTSKEIFTLNNNLLPCWQESDLNLGDNWLTATDYYPVYYSLVKLICSENRNAKFLEFGVRTGYIGALFCKASCGSGLYVGVDINNYVKEGLNLASKTLLTLREEYTDFNYFLVNGSTFDSDIQDNLSLNAPFDLVHIDGDHTLKGKLNDLYLTSLIVHSESIVLVDDFDHLADIVVDAIKRAIELGWFTRFYYIATKRGLAILQK